MHTFVCMSSIMLLKNAVEKNNAAATAGLRVFNRKHVVFYTLFSRLFLKLLNTEMWIKGERDSSDVHKIPILRRAAHHGHPPF